METRQTISNYWPWIRPCSEELWRSRRVLSTNTLQHLHNNHQIIRKPNRIIIVLLSSNMLSLILIDIKFWSSFACFTASSGYEGIFSVADILHIADVIHQVYSCCSCYAFRQQFSYFFFMKCVKCQMPFPTSLQNIATLSPGLLVCQPFFWQLPCTIWRHVQDITDIFQIWLWRISQKDLSQSEM